MKKFFVLIAFLLLLPGCDSAKKQNEIQVTAVDKMESAIPFLTYYYNQDKSEVIARLSYWDIENSKVSFTDIKVYTAFLNINSLVNPVMWDGNKKIALYYNCSPDAAYKENAEVMKGYEPGTIYGRDIEAKRSTDKSSNWKVQDYTLYLYGGNGVVEKKAVFLFHTKDEGNNDVVVGESDIPSYIDYNRGTGEITFIFKYFFRTHSSLFIARCNSNSIENVEWQEIILSKDIIAGGGLTPYPVNTALIGSKYYIQSSNSFAEVDLTQKTSRLLADVNNTCRNIVKEGKYVPDHSKEICPVGVYNDTLLLRTPVSSDTGLEYVICAFKDNVFLGAIHLRLNDTWGIIDKNKKISEEINVKNMNLYKEFRLDYLYFPFYGVS